MERGSHGGKRDGREGRRSEVKGHHDSVIITTVTSVHLTMCQVPC